MKPLLRWLTASVACAAFAFSAVAQNTGKDVTLKAGDPAPPLAVGKWVKGEPIKALEKGKIYVIECWATWCGPCVVMMPHVTKLQKQYADKGVVVLGVNVWERNPALVEPFVKNMGAKMGYAVVMDEIPAADPAAEGGRPPEGAMARTWLKAAGRSGIPCSFVVDREGKIAWIGHPAQMDAPVKMLVEGTFSADALKKLEEEYAALSKSMQEQMKAGSFDDAEKTLEKILTQAPAMGAFLNPMKLQIAIKKGDYARVNAIARGVLEGEETRDDSAALGRTVSMMIDQGDPAKIDKKLALEIAQKLYEVEQKKGWQAEWVLAKAYGANLDWDKAIEHQTKALESAPAQLKPMMQKTLDELSAKETAAK